MSFFRKFAICAIAFGLTVPAFANANISHTSDKSHSTTTTAQSVLAQAGLTDSIVKTAPSAMAGMRELTLSSGASFTISDDLTHLISGKIEKNPSTIMPIDPALMANQPVGTLISDEYRQALLANMHALPNLTEHSQFFYTPLADWLWGIAGKGSVSFLVSKDGRYFADSSFGQLVDQRLVLSDASFVPAKNRQILSKLSSDAMAVYPAKGKQRAVLYVATDIHCPYCRLLHQNIRRYNELGITIKAIGYPVYDESVVPMRQIWCETDNAKRAMLLSAAMKGIFAKDGNCQSPIPTQTLIDTQALEIFATPAVYNAQGELFLGDVTDLAAVSEFLGL